MHVVHAQAQYGRRVTGRKNSHLRTAAARVELIIFRNPDPDPDPDKIKRQT
jgi:hypothetical protein